MKKFFFALAAFLLISANAFSLIRIVPTNFPTIQGAINASFDGDTVLVEPGTYFENINYREKSIVVTSRYYLNNDKSFITSTIINGSTPQFPDSGSVVRITHTSFVNDTTTVLQGFTLTGGTGTAWADEHSPGTYTEGGGILIAYSSPVIQDNIITGNEAYNISGLAGAGGGGIRMGDGNPRVINNIIKNNRGRYGAGVVMNYTGCYFANNVVCDNTGAMSFGGGGGLWINNDNGYQKRLYNNTIVRNQASTVRGGGIYMTSGVVFMKNSIVFSNTPSNFQVYGSGITATNCDVQGGIPGSANINADPLFGSTNFYLASNSPCIDKGDSTAAFNDIQDPSNPGNALYPSLGGLRNDIGAYGGQLAEVIASGVVGINTGEHSTPGNFKLLQNFPNPFNPSTTLKYELSSQGSVKLTVFDLLGKHVADLVDQKQNAGSYSVNFEGSKFASGIYFYELNVNGNVQRKSMILLK